MVGFSRLYISILPTTRGVATFGLEPPIPAALFITIPDGLEAIEVAFFEDIAADAEIGDEWACEADLSPSAKAFKSENKENLI